MENKANLHDYREDVVARKKNKEYWGKWDSWNILYKTLAYELSSSKDVESYPHVRESIIKDSNLDEQEVINYVGEDYTFDIMNGWWGCFKALFKLNGRRNKETKKFLLSMMSDIMPFERKKLVKYISSEPYNLKPETVKNLLDFLEVIYTAGNIVPVPKGANKYYGILDNWEVKFGKIKNYSDGYKNYFKLREYAPENIIDIKQNGSISEEKISNYMETRIKLIKNRAKLLEE